MRAEPLRQTELEPLKWAKPELYPRAQKGIKALISQVLELKQLLINFIGLLLNL